MKAWVRYGKGRLGFSVPDGARIIQCPAVEPLVEPVRCINEALEHPIGSESLVRLAGKLGPMAKVVVVISDITRPVPNETLLEPLLAKLEDCGVERGRLGAG